MKLSAQFFKWGFFLLLLLNIMLIAIPFFHKRDHHHGPPPFGRIIEEMDKDLQLDAKQRSEIEKLFKRHQKEKDSLHAGLEQEKKQMYECLKNEEPCEPVFEHLSDKKADFERLHFEHHKRILKVLKQKQKVKYLDHLKHGPLGGPPGPPPF